MAQMPEIIVLRKKKETKTTIEYEELKPKTNADLIRAMTDEELAEIIPERVDCSECPARIGDYRACKEKCKETWLDWLKREADE